MNKRKQSDVNSKYTFDILSCCDTAAKLVKLYGSDDEDDDEKTWSKMITLLPKIYTTHSWTELVKKSEYVSGMRIGDIVNISHIPNSQKYLDYYEQYGINKGLVLFVDSVNNDAIIATKSADGIKFQSFVREGCHYFGMSRGYESVVEVE
jgi:hypothetical protein